MTVEEFAEYERLLGQHDWSYEFSEDSRVWDEGRAQRRKLEEMRDRLDPDHHLWNIYKR